MTFLKHVFLFPFETASSPIFIINLLYMTSASVASSRMFASSVVFVLPSFSLPSEVEQTCAVSSPEVLKEISAGKKS